VTFRGWEGQEKCKRGHDLTAPRAIAVDSSTGKRLCRLCRNMRKLASLRAQQRKCRHCGLVLPVGRVWQFCSTACEREVRGNTKRKSQDQKEAERTRIMLELYDRLEQAGTSWERAEARAAIEAAQRNET